MKQTPFEELQKATNIVCEGRFYLSLGLEALIIEDYRNHFQLHQLRKEPSLSTREFEVLQLLAERCTTKPDCGKNPCEHKKQLRHIVIIL